MKMAQHYCLKWNNYQSNMSEVFQNMLLNENLCDVTLACEGASVKAHKMVLAACSPFFQSLFMSNPCKHPIVILKDVRFIDLKALIDFMYRGEVNVSEDQLSAFLKTAETLKVKGLVEVTDKQARGQLQQALLGKKKRRRRGKTGKDGFSSAESDDEHQQTKRQVTSPHRLGINKQLNAIQAQNDKDQQQQQQQQQQQHLEQHSTNSSEQNQDPQVEQMEPSRIIEHSMATAEVGVTENGTDSVIIPEINLNEEDELKQVAIIDETFQTQVGVMSMPTTTINSPTTPQARRLMMSEVQKRALKDYLNKPIAYFDVVIDDWKKSIVWKYFGELAYKDADSGTVNIIDNERHYCLKCIIESQEKNPEEDFEKSNICFLSNGTATGNHKNHLRQRHHIIEDTPRTPRSNNVLTSSGKVKKRNSRVMTIQLETTTLPVAENDGKI